MVPCTAFLSGHRVPRGKDGCDILSHTKFNVEQSVGRESTVLIVPDQTVSINYSIFILFFFFVLPTRSNENAVIYTKDGVANRG